MNIGFYLKSYDNISVVLWPILSILCQILHHFQSLYQVLNIYLGYFKYDFVYQTLCGSRRGPGGLSKKNRLDHDENLPNPQLYVAIALQEHTPSNNRKFFKWLLKFSNQVAQFSSYEEALRSFPFQEKHPTSCILGFSRSGGS